MLKLQDNKEILLKSGRHVPKIRRNLIYVGMLDDVGCIVTMNEGFLRVLKESRTVIELPKCNGLYIMKNVHPLDHALLVRCREDERLELWHKRLFILVKMA